MNAYRVAGICEPLVIEPERPWFPRELEYVRIRASEFHAGQIGRVGYVSGIKGQVYLITFPRCTCRRSVDCKKCRGKDFPLCGLFFLQELEPQ